MIQTKLESPPKEQVVLEEIYKMVQTELTDVGKSLLQIITPETRLLAESINYSLQNRGKLLRPLISLLASGSTGSIDSSHIETAAVAELIHVATLLHDDVLDDADTRRGRETVRSQWGNKISILSGDYLLAQASLKLSLLNRCRLVSIFAKVLSNLCEGEVEQICTSYNMATSWESYFKKSICKTAALFGACCESAAVLNNMPEEHIEMLKAFGEKFGIAFQIIDDLLDYTSSKELLGKPVLDDLKNGILNAPVLLALESLKSQSGKEHNKLQKLIESLFDNSSAKDDQESHREIILRFFDATDAICQTEIMAARYMKEARDSIAFLPDTKYKDALIGLTHYAVRREY